MKVLISLGKSFYESCPELGDWLRRDGIEVEELILYDYPPPKEEIKRAVKDAEIYVVGVDHVDREIMTAASKLKLIIKHGAGYDNIDLECAREKNIAVTFARGCNAQSVAELTIGLMFAVSRRIAESYRIIMQGGWNLYMGEELSGKTLGILGFGNIGRRVASMAKGLGMKIMAYDPFVQGEEMEKVGVVPAEFHQALERADYVSVHMPATKENEGILNEQAFCRMKRTAYFINTSRGEIVKEEDLRKCLKNKLIGGAALDVFSQEPPEKEMLELDNVVYTSHIGACTMESARLLAEASYNNIKNYIKKQPLNDRLI